MEEIVLKYGLYYIVFFIILYMMFRKYMYSVFDPMMLVVLMMASSLALSIGSFFFIYILLAILSFYIGCKVNGKVRRNFSSNVSFRNIRLLEVYTISFFILYIFANFMLYKDSQIPLFSNNTTEDKIAIFTEGTGWIRRILFFSQFLPISLLLLCIASKKKFFYFILLCIYLIMSVLLGSKTGFLGVFIIGYYFYTQRNLWNSGNARLKHFIKTKSKYIVIGSLVIFILIVIKENSDNLIYSVGYRLMEFGDSIIYYKSPIVQHYFSNFNIIDFVLNELNGILGMFRITSYIKPLGYQMVAAYWGGHGSTLILGPNCIFLIRGHIFFGYIGGLIYCFVIGYFFSLIRKRILMQNINNVFFYSLSIYLFFSLIRMLREFSQFISSLFDLILFTSPLFVLALFLDSSLRKKQNATHFFN